MKMKTVISLRCIIFRKHFGCDHPKYADTLIDYGYYLLNVDAIHLSVKVYKVSAALLIVFCDAAFLSLLHVFFK